MDLRVYSNKKIPVLCNLIYDYLELELYDKLSFKMSLTKTSM